MSGMYNQINYTSNYKKIIEVKVNHDYFKDNKCISFLFKPTGETLSLFKNYGILFKKTQSGFVLISGADLRFSSAAFNGPIEVEISMSNNDPVFLNYSEISPSTGEGFLFQNSFEANTLHQEEYVDASVLTPMNSSKLMEGTIKLSFNQNNEFFGEGSENSNAVGEKYRINFKSREVVVRYNFYSSKDNLDFSNFFIADDENSFKNDTIEKRNLANGQEVFCIQHPSPVKLSQFYDKSLFLKKEDGFLNTFSIQLPQPDVKNVSFDKNDSKYYADLFVSLD
jgi:hypothetical protein